MPEPCYSTDGLAARAEATRQACAAYLHDLAARYARRVALRQANHWPALGICGHGRAGKDTAAEYLCAYTGTVYPGSCSTLMLPLVTHLAGLDPDLHLHRARVFRERHEHRQFWIEACHALRGGDYSMLVRMTLAAGDVSVGIRGRLELEHACHDRVLQLTVWVDNPRVPADVTVEYGPEDCDLVLCNHGSRRELYGRLRRLVGAFRSGWFPLTSSPTKGQDHD